MALPGYLLVTKGDPHPPNCRLELSSEQVLLGRQFQEYCPDMPFNDPHISRRHAIIAWDGSLFSITDLSSKHGTSVNQISLQPGKAYHLYNGDTISLAKNIVQLKFLSSILDGATTDLTSPLIESGLDMLAPVIIDSQRREVIVEGNPVFMQGKEIELLIALYENKARAVSYDEIRRLVWPERPEGVTPGVPDVDTSEITTLVYRLRQKLGAYGSSVTTVPRYGYRLDL